MNPLLIQATSPHQCDICAGLILIGEKYYRHTQVVMRSETLGVTTFTESTVRECASCAQAAGRWTE